MKEDGVRKARFKLKYHVLPPYKIENLKDGMKDTKFKNKNLKVRYG